MFLKKLNFCAGVVFDSFELFLFCLYFNARHKPSCVACKCTFLATFFTKLYVIVITISWKFEILALVSKTSISALIQ